MSLSNNSNNLRIATERFIKKDSTAIKNYMNLELPRLNALRKTLIELIQLSTIELDNLDKTKHDPKYALGILKNKDSFETSKRDIERRIQIKFVN